MVNVLGIGLDYLMLLDDKVRGDVRERQLEYAKRLESLTLIVYSPKELGLKNQKWADNLWIYPTNSKNKMAFILDALKIAKKICRARKRDVITTEDPFTTGFVGYLLKRKFKIPLNVQMHIDFYDNPYWIEDEKINRVFNKMGKWLVKRADTLRMGTSREKKKLENIGIPVEKLYVIPVDSKPGNFGRVSGEQIRNKYCKNKFNKMILFVGRFTRQKDIPTLLRTFSLVMKNLPATLLVLVGTGKEENNLKTLVDALNLTQNTIFAGAIPHNLIPEYLAACDVFVIPSIFEGTCIALAEAAMSGKPIVSTDVAGVDDLMINGKPGYIVRQRDYREMAEKIMYLLNNPQKAKNLGELARNYVERQFDENKDIDGLINLWEHTAEIKVKK